MAASLRRRLRGVHIVVSGSPQLALDDGTTRMLGPGDLVVLPRADAHTMSSSADVRRPPEVLAASGNAAYSSLKLADSSPDTETVFGDGGAETRIVCGVFFFADADHPAVAGFPSCIHVPADAHWRHGCRADQALVAETIERGPGSDVVMARLRMHCHSRSATTRERERLHGLRDPQFTALSALHREWGGGLPPAREAGLSRAAFAARFTALVGQSPMEQPPAAECAAPDAARSDASRWLVPPRPVRSELSAYSSADDAWGYRVRRRELTQIFAAAILSAVRGFAEHVSVSGWSVADQQAGVSFWPKSARAR
jgi:hypothetical protein